MGVSEGSGSSVAGSLGDGEAVSLGVSLGLWLGDSLGESLGDAVGLGRLVGRTSEGICVGRAGSGDVDSPVDSSTERGLAGTVSTVSGASLLPGAALYGSLSVGVVGFFSNGATGDTGEIRLIPDSSLA
ncbi:hypothetical protein ACFVJS_20900 [Nocardioides sp. NPDC057772]|uniref:hypothetical protein n=1 Tax=Nocardioides sp. NPDC057772 TaxID=3346245 RepID=UPI00366DD94C